MVDAQFSQVLFTEKLDSIVHTRVCAGGEDGFYSYQYDVLGRTIKEIQHTGKSSVTPIDNETTHYYKPNGLLDSSVIIHFLSPAVKTVKRCFYIGADLDSTSTIIFFATPADSAGYSYKCSYTASGKLRSQINYKMVLGQTTYSFEEKRVWVYNTQQELIADSLYLPDNQGNLTLYSYSLYTYDLNSGKLLSAIQKDWIGNVEGQYNYFYDSVGSLYFEQYIMGNTPYSGWGYCYDSVGNITDMTYFAFSQQSWDPIYTYNTVYDGILATTTAMPKSDVPSVLDKLFRLHRPTVIRYVDTAYSASILLTRSNYYYSGGVGVVNNTRSNEFSVIPNPVSDYLMIKLLNDVKTEYQVIVTDLQGRVMLSQRVNSDNKVIHIGIQSLPSGLYLLTLGSANGLYFNQKFVKL
ncbi:MAG TPA: T9SS type A sorting domain-containing protein [Bacteroidales bacterium]|nr:T9SS type A sorting domain-containing protein [Bacteroidales bacterium]